MIYFLALVPATILTMPGCGVLFLAQRAEGPLKSFGGDLGFWAFTLAGLLVVRTIVAVARGESMHAMMVRAQAGCESVRQCPYLRSWRHPPPNGTARGLPDAPLPATPEAAPPK